jgi:T5SS/PEP-CTERM-associated repeat protein
MNAHTIEFKPGATREHDGGTMRVTGGELIEGETGAFSLDGVNAPLLVLDNATMDLTGRDLNIGLGQMGSLDIQNGGTAFSNYAYIGANIGSAGAVTVDNGSWWDNARLIDVGSAGAGSLNIHSGGLVTSLVGKIGKLASGSGGVTVAGPGSSWSNTTNLIVGEYGWGVMDILDGGAVYNVQGYIASEPGSTGVVTVEGAGATWYNSDLLGIAGRNGPGGSGTLNIHTGGLVEAVNEVRIGSAADVNLWGGTLRTAHVTFFNNAIDFAAGTLHLTQGLFLDPEYASNLDVTELSTGKTFRVDGPVTLGTSLTLSGGTLSVPSIVGYGFVDFQTGTFHLTEDDLTIGPGGLAGADVQLRTDQRIDVTHNVRIASDGRLDLAGGRLGAGKLTNDAVIQGYGRIDGPVTNTSTGEINHFGGELLFSGEVTNESGGFIGGRGRFIAEGGWTNRGVMSFSVGSSDVLGDVVNEPGGVIVTTGGATTTFYGDLTHNGAEIRTAADSGTVILGAASGAGVYTGAGSVYFEGDLRPGNSPNAVSFGGDVVLGPNAQSYFELGGVVPGLEHDQIHVAGSLGLGGDLVPVLIDNYLPVPLDAYTLATFDSLSGDFDAIQDQQLANELLLVPEVTSTTYSLVAAIPADFNLDGLVGVADLIVWASHFGNSDAGFQIGDANLDAVVSVADLVVWAKRFGQSAADYVQPIRMEVSAVAIPEPQSLVVMCLGFLVVIRPRRLDRAERG